MTKGVRRAAATSHGVRLEIVERLDPAAVVALYQAGGWWKESRAWRAQIPKMIEGSLVFVTATTREGRVVGMGRAISDGASDAYIQDVVVMRELRGHGIGARIISRLVRELRRRKVGWIGLVAEPGTTRFYRRLGFEPLVGYQPMLFQGKAS
ncbi:MAG: GNAT family N-acetyltransferase [Deltaproteobacteria bacterium]|nr:GNAT family N-acetyltransferase [Deltaproteobacteria bacterium]